MRGITHGPGSTPQRNEEPDVSRNETAYSLTPELLAEASWRLGWLGLVYAGGSIVTYFGRRLLLALTVFVDRRCHLSDLFGLHSSGPGHRGLWRLPPWLVVTGASPRSR